MKEKIVIASDHAGFFLKGKVMKHLEERGLDVHDCGTYSEESCDYPDFAHKAASAVDRGDVKRGIVICGSGNGVSMTANKYLNVRCALAWTPEIAQLGRRHNDCNMVGIPARFISEETAMQIVDMFIDTKFEGGRHERRVNKINQLIK